MLTFRSLPTAVDVPIFPSNPAHAHPLLGNHANTDVGHFIAE